MAAGVTAMYNDQTVDEPDRHDIAASLGGDEAAFSRLIRRHEAAVAALLWRFAREPAACEELVQDVFVEAYFSLRGYRGEAPLDHWLKRIASRVGYRYWKRRSRRAPPLSLSEQDVAAPAGDPDLAQASAAAHALLDRLAPAARLVLTLMYFDDCSVQEIAERMGWTRAMVKMRAYRARRRLQAIAQREHLAEKLGWTS
ncbi:MAG: RNA polymerase sigma factor [Planctomycetota bacterium]|nr:RNA polymerase sigma factor [Planctomycetota bacterium]